jgi:IS5 family transposase
MSKKRFRPRGGGSFFGELIYERAVSQDNFLRKLSEVVDWEPLMKKLAPYYKGGAEYGPPPYDPALLLKMLLLSYLYNLSERQIEELCNDSLSVKCFLGLSADERAPDHSTLTLFKARLLHGRGLTAYKDLLQEVVRLAQEKGIVLGRVQLVDSVHTLANVNTSKDKGRQKEGEGPRDPDARWGAKGKKQGRTQYFYGYKQHVSLDAETGLITSVYHSDGSAYDGHYLMGLIEQDMEQGIPIEVVAADRGYDDGENHYFLEVNGIEDAICLKGYRTQKKDPNKEGWLVLRQSTAYQEGQRVRYKIERKFGEMKTRHGFGRCRYVGLLRYAIQGYLTVVVVNLKRMVKLLLGVSLRNQRYPLPNERSSVFVAT